MARPASRSSALDGSGVSAGMSTDTKKVSGGPELPVRIGGGGGGSAAVLGTAFSVNDRPNPGGSEKKSEKTWPKPSEWRTLPAAATGPLNS